jgi:hypothetical protein
MTLISLFLALVFDHGAVGGPLITVPIEFTAAGMPTLLGSPD